MAHEKLNVVVAGAGAMGTGIAQVALLNNCRVVVYDSYDAALQKSEQKLFTDLHKLSEKGKITAEVVEQCKKNISFSNSLNSVTGAGLFIEAIIEDLQTKQNLFTDVERMVDDNCILATNTSSLSVISIGANCKKQDRVVGLHFFNPAAIMPLVEIVPSLNTSQAVVEKCKLVIDSFKKIAVIAKDTPGFIVNRIARPYYGEAIRIYEEGVANFATIDWAMKEKGGFKMGPFELMDFIGNDINYKVTETVFEQMFYDQRYKPSQTQKRLYEGKLFGRKTGKGYFNYADGATMPEPLKNDKTAEKICNRILCMLINESADALLLNIATKEDIDLAMTKGVNYPKGLLKWCDEIGAANVLATLTELFEWYGEDRYRPSPLLKTMAKQKATFY
ncbi:MAG TPA: 3-hydroxyacyl-CoA dehydrogenase NAD-binding domain-containing protein [Bacteroidia bacterium]|nr:3-hydroxyacyl-CoA dehydrogenase NAD-binding domain-containing protein [Bacteroidia bacterium]HNU34891.1 3-hydroxyacyl-CoA dehydrogenase NAD-binding domain-containing protein [Bacteroidia bacterium]